MKIISQNIYSYMTKININTNNKIFAMMIKKKNILKIVKLYNSMLF